MADLMTYSESCDVLVRERDSNGLLANHTTKPTLPLNPVPTGTNLNIRLKYYKETLSSFSKVCCYTKMTACSKYP